MMSLRCSDLPFLPGCTFNSNIGRQNFHLNPTCGFIGKGNRTLIEKVSTKLNIFEPPYENFKSNYSTGQSVEPPNWIKFDKQILCFSAFFQETLQEVRGSPFQVRNVKIYYFLEDGTIQVVEPKVQNSGISQGTLISRQRIRFPPPMDENFYDLVDFNIGREVEFHGRIFKITNCDKFTRTFLNRCGILVPDPIAGPTDSYIELRSNEGNTFHPKKFKRSSDTLGKFLQNDGKVLRFKAYWDDQDTDYGYLHYLELRYYLADDTIAIRELQSESVGEPGFMFLRRAKLPKRCKELPPVGSHVNYTVLNVLGSSLSNRRYIIDPLVCERDNIEYYTEKDLSIGGVVHCYGRKLILTDCDTFTKEYYTTKYGISEFNPIPIPAKNRASAYSVKHKKRELPPWNGFGSYEDSAQNCLTVEPKAPHRDFKKFLLYDRTDLNSHILRFKAKMISTISENCSRCFVISYFLVDDTISVFEIGQRNSGFNTSTFAAKKQVKLPDQESSSSTPPLYYTPQHMFIGATLIINEFKFVLVDADEYAMRYMELNCGQFPKANLKRIMKNVREKLAPIYKDFVAENIPEETSVMPYSQLWAKLCSVMDEDFTEHEMITIAREFSASCCNPKEDREKIRAIALTELKRYLWDDLDRLREYFVHADYLKTGKLTKKECYTVLKGARLPFDNELLKKILDVANKDEEGKLTYDEILQFLDRNICAPPDEPPINTKSNLWSFSEPRPEAGQLIDWCAFNKYLDLESTFRDTIQQDTIKMLEKQ
ncbi:EF-hand domain-containing family member C2-like [Euwallacea fornicatus]|uniref:EF-hand domain-containing family member C2-like n=1 Tax=Euwallacea fornicatus TaxID=995702 RepID=UPI00338ED100